MIIICINRPQDTHRAANIREWWAPHGEVLFMPATVAEECEPEQSVRPGRILVPGEVATRKSHNRAIRLIRDIGKTCCMIEDDARPLPGFAWPEFHGTTRLQLEGRPGRDHYGGAAQLVGVDCQEIPDGHAADWWPPGYPIERLDRYIVEHGAPDSTTVEGRPGNHRTLEIPPGQARAETPPPPPAAQITSTG